MLSNKSVEMMVTTLPTVRPYSTDWASQPEVQTGQKSPGCAVAPAMNRPLPFNQPVNPDEKAKKILMAMSLYGLAAASHKLPLPLRLPGDGFKTILPSDWKVWARVFMGIGAVHQLNQALNWKPPPWLGALETLAVVNPLAAGFKLGAVIQTAVMAPLVMGVVQGVSMFTDVVDKPLKTQLNVPPVVTQLGLTTIASLGAFLIYPPFYKMVAQTGLIGKELKQQAEKSASAFATATFSTCARGCSPGSFICLGELADIGGSMGLWLKNKFASQNKNTKDQAGPA